MAGKERLDGGIAKSPRETWIDLVAVAVLAVLAGIVVVAVGGDRPSPLRIALGMPLLAFLPGYAVVAALFPARRTTDDRGRADERDDTLVGKSAAVRDRGIDAIERVALSVGLSAAIVPLSGLALVYLGWAIKLVPIVVAVGGITLLAATIAAWQRARLAPNERFAVPYRDWTAAVKAETVRSQSRADAVLSVLVVLGLLVAMSSVVYAVAAPGQGSSQGTELYLLTQNESGDLVAEGYPDTINQSETERLHVGVTNGDRGPAEYTLIVQIERVEETNSSGLRVVEREQLHRSEMTLGSGESWQGQHAIDPEMTGEELRLTYLLYRGDAPAADERTPDDAYRSVSLRVDVN